MKHWFKDSSFRSLLKNSSYLAVSRVIAAICAIATLGFAGRDLGPVLFGLLILIHSYAQLASGVARFQSWQLIIRYGAPGLTRDDPKPFQEVTGFALALDLVSGVGGMILAIALLPVVGPWFSIPPEYIAYAMIYCLLLPTMGAATPIGVLRALDRFDLIAWQGTVTPILRAILAFAAWWAGAPFLTYLAIWFVTDLAGDLYMWFLAWREMSRRRLGSGVHLRLRPRNLPGAWRFAVNVNLASSLNVARGPLINLLVGVILGPAAAGLYKIAKSLAESIDKPADMLNKAFYPEVMRLDFASKRPWKLMIRGAAVSALFGAMASSVIIFAGRPLITAIFGVEYAESYSATAIMLIGTYLGVLTFPVTAMLYALHKSGTPLVAKAIGIGVSLAALYPLCVQLGLEGAALAYVIGTAISISATVFVLHREYRATFKPGVAGAAAP